MKFILVVWSVLHIVGQRCTTAQAPICQPQSTCSECLKSPGCAWCTEKGFLNPGESNERRCDSPDSLRYRQCKNEVINPSASTIPLRNSSLNSDLKNVVQLQPQNINVKLRVGVPHEFKVKFRRAEGYPIDLYYLMDLSYSMKDDLEKIKNLGQHILSKLQEVTEKVRIGFGSFVDKERLPYVSQTKRRLENPCPNRLDTCERAFTFKNVLPLTDKAKDFKDKVSKQKISGNLDSPEAGLDAIMQAAVCQKEIEWGNVTRILVYTSDDTFHMAGDGRLAGIFQPHDGQCHLNNDGFYDGTAFDYPSIGHLSRVLQANNIQLIFAVTEKSFPAYQALSALIPQSVVGVLEDDSGNVVQLISEAYGNLSSTLLLEQDRNPTGVEVLYKSHCRTGGSGEWQQRGECTGVKVNEQVEFDVRLTASECLKEAEEFEIRIQGISEVLMVTVETLCECDCGANVENSSFCSNTGTLVCGVCSCNPGRLGQRCECEGQSTSEMEAHCRRDENSQICSGRGRCECSQCKCSRSFSGRFCECDNDSCERHNNKICNGKGDCRCSKCKCNANYTGSACECSMHTDKCGSKNGMELCTGQGECECNRCKCKAGFMGDDCSQFVNPCAAYKACVECIVTAEGRGDKSGNCTWACGSVKLVRLEGSHELHCVHNTVSYSVTLQHDGIILIQYADLPRTIDKTTMIISTSVSAIIIIGIVFIVVYRVLLELYDRREYHSFIRAQEQSKWNETHNPLFQGATTTVLNPLHSQDG